MTAAVRDEAGAVLFHVSCIHLVPVHAELRTQEVARIAEDLQPLFRADRPQLWLGDFNTLSRADYTDTEWQQIVQIRGDAGQGSQCKIPNACKACDLCLVPYARCNNAIAVAVTAETKMIIATEFWQTLNSDSALHPPLQEG